MIRCDCKSKPVKTISYKCQKCGLEFNEPFDLEDKKIDLVIKMLYFLKERNNGTENKD